MKNLICSWCGQVIYPQDKDSKKYGDETLHIICAEQAADDDFNPTF
jgi:hypothetical protein